MMNKAIHFKTNVPQRFVNTYLQSFAH